VVAGHYPHGRACWIVSPGWSSPRRTPASGGQIPIGVICPWLGTRPDRLGSTRPVAFQSLFPAGEEGNAFPSPDRSAFGCVRRNRPSGVNLSSLDPRIAVCLSSVTPQILGSEHGGSDGSSTDSVLQQGSLLGRGPPQDIFALDGFGCPVWVCFGARQPLPVCALLPSVDRPPSDCRSCPIGSGPHAQCPQPVL